MLRFIANNPRATFQLAKTLYNNPLTRDVVTHTVKQFAKQTAAGTIATAGAAKLITSSLPTPPQTSSKKRAHDYKPTSGNKKLKFDMPKYKQSKKTGNYKRKGKAFKAKRRYIKKKQRKPPSKTLITMGGMAKWGMSYKKPKEAQALKQLRSDVIITRRGAFVNSASPGTQNATLPMDDDKFLLAQSDLFNFFETGAKTYSRVTDNAGTLQSVEWHTSSAADSATVVGNRAGKRMYITKCNCYVNMTNQGPTSCEFVLYWLTPKQSERSFQDPLSLWSNGLSAAAKNSSFVKSRNAINCKPTESRDFNFSYTIVKKVVGKLDPGQEQKIQTAFSPKRFIDLDYLNDFQLIKGMQLIPMLVTKGVAADCVTLDSTLNNVPGPTSLNSDVTTTRTKITGVYTNTYSGYICDKVGAARKDFQSPAYVQPTLQTAPAAAGQVGVFSIADAAGTVVDSNKPTNFA